jgi:hypothetical protein
VPIRPRHRAALLAAFALFACAGEDEPALRPVRPGQDPTDAVFFPPADAEPPDAALPDAALPDAGVTPRPPRRRTLVAVRDEAWGDGLRARLEPAQTPLGVDPLAALPDAALLVRWAGPDSPSTARLTALAAAGGRTFTVLYDLRARGAARPGEDLAALATADASWLAAHVGGAADLWRLDDGRPLLGAAFGPGEAAAWRAAKARLSALPGDFAWLVEVDVATDPAVPEDAVAVLPAGAYGYAVGGDRAVEAAVDGLQLARWRAATLEAGAVWLPRARPPRNPRRAQPAGAVEPPDEGALARSLVLARRGVTPAAPWVVVDAVGAWTDDTQIDAVMGATTAAPAPLTSGLTYAAYGEGRVAAVAAALARPAGAPPDDLAAPPALLPLVRGDRTLVRRLERSAEGVHLALEGPTERFEVLLDGRPFLVPEGARLVYERSDATVWVDLVFEDGDRLHDRQPPPAGAGAVEVPLAAFAGRRAEEVTLVHPGGAPAVEAELRRVRIAP